MSRWIVLVSVCFSTSCQSEKKAALSLTSERGVTASEEALLSALEKDDSALADALLTLDVSPSCRDSFQRTPLMLAAGGNSATVVLRLLEMGVDVEDQDSTGRTALNYALEAGNLEAMVNLLDRGANPTIPVDTGGNLIVQALQQGKIAAVLLLLDAGASPRSRGGRSETLSWIAVETGQLMVLKELVQRGVDLKKERGTSEGLLHLAFKNDRDDILIYLLEQGLDPETLNSKGETLVHAAVAASKVHLIPLLKKHGASLDTLDPLGWTPLHLAILSRNAEMLNCLLEEGADFEKRSKTEDVAKAPISLTIEGDLFAMTRRLLRSGASPGDELYQAVRRGGKDGCFLVELMLESGASASPSRAPLVDSPLGLAVRTGEYEIAKLLLDAGAPSQSRDLSGQKPLHIAVAKGHAELVGLLLDRGADPNEPFHAGITESFLNLVETKGIGRWALQNSKSLYPVMLAADSGNVEVARQLIAHGADRTKSTLVKSNRMWPLTFATRRNDTQMMQVMLGRKPGRSHLWVKVDLSEQRAYVYEGEKEIYTTRVSTGKSGYQTRQGEFVITNKYTDWKSTIYESSMPYFQRLSASDFGFHVGYVPGYPASHGCIRMPAAAARKLFGMTKVGDTVEIVP